MCVCVCVCVCVCERERERVCVREREREREKERERERERDRQTDRQLACTSEYTYAHAPSQVWIRPRNQLLIKTACALQKSLITNRRYLTGEAGGTRHLAQTANMQISPSFLLSPANRPA